MLLFLLKLFTFYDLVKKISEVTNKFKIMFLSAVNKVSILCFSSIKHSERPMSTLYHKLFLRLAEKTPETSLCNTCITLLLRYYGFVLKVFSNIVTVHLKMFYVVCTMIKFFLVTTSHNLDFCRVPVKLSFIVCSWLFKITIYCKFIELNKEF